MLVNWAYVERNTIIHRLDPRARIIFMLCALISVGFVPGGTSGAGIWDIRLVLVFLFLAFLQIFLARLSWQQTRRFWIVITIVGVVLSIITLLTGRGAVGIYDLSAQHPFWSLNFSLFGRPIRYVLTVERLVFLITQILRIITFAALSVTIPYTINPALYGITFKGRNFAPLLIPLTIGAIMGGEEVTDAMDLRAFGVGPRTWLPQLKFRALDWVLVGFGVFLLAGTIVMKQAGWGDFWVPPFMIR